MIPTPQQLDAQSPVKLDGWVDMDSQRWREVDNDPALTKSLLKMLMKEPAFLITDNLGRVFGKGQNGIYYPYHIEYGKKKYGIRLAKKAAN